MLNNLRNFFKPLITFFAYPLSFLDPNLITVLSVVVAIPGFYFLSQGEALLGSTFIIGALLDVMDGAVAKMTGKISKLGGIFDATVDRLFEGALFLSLGIGELVSWELLFLTMIFSFSATFVKAKAEAMAQSGNVGIVGNKFAVGIFERGERILFIFLACIIHEYRDVMEPFFIIIVAGSILTFIARSWVVYKEFRQV